MTSTSTPPAEKGTPPAGTEAPAPGGARPRAGSLDAAAVAFAALAVLITVAWVGGLVFLAVRVVTALLGLDAPV